MHTTRPIEPLVATLRIPPIIAITVWPGIEKPRSAAEACWLSKINRCLTTTNGLGMLLPSWHDSFVEAVNPIWSRHNQKAIRENLLR